MRYSPWGHKESESDTTEQLSTHIINNIYMYYIVLHCNMLYIA